MVTMIMVMMKMLVSLTFALISGATDINNCWSYPCVNDGTCEDLYQDYRCSCPIPYTGKNCDVDLGKYEEIFDGAMVF